tara:strand:- start:373 stop:579 length:207 start_codon:yes stop_codon:yes gene_type:complete
MWTPIVLMCSFLGMQCATYGGPAFETEASCYLGMQQIGIPYLKEKFPELIIMDKKCVYWDFNNTKVDT